MNPVRKFLMLIQLLSSLVSFETQSAGLPVQKVVSGVLSREGRILLLRRSDEEIQFPGYFNLPGGKVGKDEIERNALIREIKEETGIDVSIGSTYNRWGWTATIKGEPRRFELTSFRVEAKGFSEVVLSPEHTAFKWVSRAELDEIQITPELRADLEIAFDSMSQDVCESGLSDDF